MTTCMQGAFLLTDEEEVAMSQGHIYAMASQGISQGTEWIAGPSQSLFQIADDKVPKGSHLPS